MTLFFAVAACGSGDVVGFESAGAILLGCRLNVSGFVVDGVVSGGVVAGGCCLVLSSMLRLKERRTSQHEYYSNH